MTNTSGFVDFLLTCEQLHLPTLRFALRSVVARGSYTEIFNDDEDRLLRLVGAALIWPESTRAAISQRFAKVSALHLPETDDAVTLSSLLLSNQSSVWFAYLKEVLNTWQLEPQTVETAFIETLAALDSAETRHRGEHPNLSYVRTLYDLNAVDLDILQFAVTSRQWFRFREFLKNMPFPSMGSAWTNLAAMTGYPLTEIRAALELKGRLRSLDLVKIDRAPDHMEEFVRVGQVSHRVFLLNADSQDSLQSRLLEPIGQATLSTADFPHLSEEFNSIVQCLKTAVQTKEKGVNILLQGPSGVGKTEFARLLVQAAGLSGFEISADENCESQTAELRFRLERLEWTQNILQTHAGAVMVVAGVNEAADQCELLLKARLDSCTVPTLWIGNESVKMSASVLRRFVFHLKFGQAPISARRHHVAKVMAGLAIDKAKQDAIAAEPDLSPAQIAMAARFTRLGAKADCASKEKVLLCAINASQRISGRTPKSLLHPAIGSAWDMDALNLETSAPLPRILEGLRRTGCASLAFHGTPGTGKSSLAAHIANTLDRPLLTKRVSDLSSKWIGETEKCIAKMFNEAASENAVLLLDEADSFLRDRSRARTSWEVTQVNELLQQIESFNGIFICATNLVKDIDAAALRRFTFKVKFLPLNDLHRRRMLASYALSDANAELPRPIGARLAALSQLSPGDFATVRRQELLIDERFSLESWITELEREHAIRVPLVKQRAGFV